MAEEHDEEVRITLRLPGHLRRKLGVSAVDTARSMNGEIVSRLELSFEAEGIIDDLNRRLQALNDELSKRVQSGIDAMFGPVFDRYKQQSETLAEFKRSFADLTERLDRIEKKLPTKK